MKFDMNKLMQQAKKAQQQLQKQKKEFDAKVFTYVSSDKLVTVKILGSKRIQEIEFDNVLLENTDAELLSDAITLNINKALDMVDEESNQMMSDIGLDPNMLSGMM